MKNFSLIKSVTVLAVLLGGCSTAQVPYTESFQTSHQKVLRASKHWDIVANDVAAQTVLAIGTNKTIYVEEPKETTDFNRAFRNFLITRMVDKNIPVSDHREDAVEVSYETQVILHNSERRNYKPGTLTALTAGLMVAYNVPNWTKVVQSEALLGAAAGADTAVSMDAGSPTKAELVVTTSAVEGGRYLVRKTDIYYLEPEDVPLFMHVEKQGTPLKRFGVVGGGWQ